MIKRLAIIKHRRGARKAGAMVGASFKSSDEGWSKRKVHAMTEDQKATSGIRLRFERYGLRAKSSWEIGEWRHVCHMPSHIVSTKEVPAVRNLYGGRAVWQDEFITLQRLLRLAVLSPQESLMTFKLLRWHTSFGLRMCGLL